MPQLFLTNDFILRAKCPPDRQQILYWDHPKSLDGKIRNGAQIGLGFRVTSNGSKSFVHTYHFNGERKRMVIGKVATMSVGAARLLVQSRQAQIEDGVDPAQIHTDNSTKCILSVRDMIDSYAEERLLNVSEKYRLEFARVIAPWIVPVTINRNRRGANMRKPVLAFGVKFGKRAAESIKPMDVATFIKSFKSDSVSNGVLGYIHALYNWAIRMQLIDMRNPCTPIDKRKIIKRRPNYTPGDVANIAAYIFCPPIVALSKQSETTGLAKRKAALARGRMSSQNSQMIEFCNFMGILFLTMARPAELKQARFDHFDLEKLIWHKHNTKGLKLSKSTYEYAFRSVPIHAHLAKIIQSQRARWPNADLVFPSHTDETRPRDNFRKPLARFKQLDGVPPDFQLYDLKRMAISLMLVGQGARREDVSHYVDHKGNLETTMIYDLGFVDPLRPVADKLGELLGV